MRVGKYDKPISFREYKKLVERKDRRIDQDIQVLYNEPEKAKFVRKSKTQSGKDRYQRMKKMYSTCKKVVTCPFCGNKIQTKAWYCTACSRCKSKFHISPAERVKKGEELTAPNVVRETC